MTTLVCETRPSARKPHRCDECRHDIPAGRRYVRQFCKDGGDTWSWVMHEDCAAAAAEQFRADGGDYFEGRTALIEYENTTGYFPDWLRGRYPHVVCRLEFWKQNRAGDTDE